MDSVCDISESEFFEVFDSPRECLLAAFDEAVARASRLVEEAAKCADGGDERVRAALSALLVFLDEEPGLARLLLDGSARDDGARFERYQQTIQVLERTLLNETQADKRNSGWFDPWSELTAELVVGGILAVLHARIREGAPEPFVELEPSLTAFIAASYQVSAGTNSRKPGTEAEAGEPPARRLPVRTTYRTTRVLSAIGASPRLSNREIAEAAGLGDEGQTSKLLRRLQRRGLLRNVGLGQPHGGPNAWLLTAYGERVLDATRHSLVPGAGAISGNRARGAS